MCMNQTAKEKVTSFRLISLTLSTSKDASQDINYSRTRKAVKVSVEISRFAPLSNLYNYFQVFPYKNILSHAAVTRLISVKEEKKGSMLAQKPCLLRIQQSSGKTYWLRIRTEDQGSLSKVLFTLWRFYFITSKHCFHKLHHQKLQHFAVSSHTMRQVSHLVLCQLSKPQQHCVVSGTINHSSEGAILVLIHFLLQIQPTF